MSSEEVEEQVREYLYHIRRAVVGAKERFPFYPGSLLISVAEADSKVKVRIFDEYGRASAIAEAALRLSNLDARVIEEAETDSLPNPHRNRVVYVTLDSSDAIHAFRSATENILAARSEVEWRRMAGLAASYLQEKFTDNKERNIPKIQISFVNNMTDEKIENLMSCLASALESEYGYDTLITKAVQKPMNLKVKEAVTEVVKDLRREIAWSNSRYPDYPLPRPDAEFINSFCSNVGTSLRSRVKSTRSYIERFPSRHSYGYSGPDR